MTIKHLVLCGGGPCGLAIYGALKYLNKKDFWNLQDIKSMYMCSIGCFYGVVVSMGLEWDWIDDFIIKRPWKKIFDPNDIEYLKIFKEKGILDETYFEKILIPLFKVKNIDINVTLKEFYNLTNIDMHFFATQLNKFDKISLNHISYPNMKLTTAIYISSCVPLLFKPYFIDNECYIDGGLLNNVPINDCFLNNSCDKDEILNFVNLSYTLDYSQEYNNNISYHYLNNNDISNNDISNNDISNNNYSINQDTTNKDLNNNTDFIGFIMFFLRKLLSRFIEINSINNINIDNTINVCLTNTSVDINFWFQILNNKDNIKNVIDFGIYKANHFLKAKQETGSMRDSSLKEAELIIE